MKQFKLPTFSTVTWMNSEDMGFILTYPAIAVHAASGATEQYPDPSLFLLVDIAKTGKQLPPSIIYTFFMCFRYCCSSRSK